MQILWHNKIEKTGIALDQSNNLLGLITYLQLLSTVALERYMQLINVKLCNVQPELLIFQLKNCVF